MSRDTLAVALIAGALGVWLGWVVAAAFVLVAGVVVGIAEGMRS